MSENGQRSFWQPLERGEYGFSKYTWKCARCGKWSHEATLECPRCESVMSTVYLCDPELNKDCRKTECFLNGGECRHTSRIECARSASQVGLDRYADFDAERRGK